ncbi:carbohydrate ABC transporter permease [Paenibacillus xerothermodurans]|uniref:Carbohydrate ABC transporter permease n=1 Tax=Paenibacillus xerothermodurans TaxID=1977292 RepID=A0A2W1NWG4_PAEXE|nr:carbohydrate ABC transporter permease [Paenibacillus xerothermodurans]PZE20002.1 carbohydrate ABC transporter permease [Paenibacillus xerothermodurans]
MKSTTAIQRGLLLLLFVILGAVALFPFYALLLASFKEPTELLRYGLNVKLQPEILNLKNYTYLFSGEGKIYFTWYKNSIMITVASTLLTLLFSSLVGYGLAVYQFKGRNLIFILVLLVMMVPVEVIMLPLYKMSITLKLIDSYWGVIIPFIVSPFAVFFFRQFATGIPKDYLDAGRIDGCTEYGIFFRIMAPLMAPAFGAMAILQALGSWNNFIWPLIVLRTDTKLTLPIGLSSMLTPYGNNYSILLSGSILSVLPILILFIIFQRSFISGLTVGGVKG